MITRRCLFLAMTVAPLVAQAACSASNGSAVPPEVHEAEELDAGGTKLPPDDDDGGSGTADSGKPTAKDAGKDVAPDAPPAAPIVISEVYVAGLGGDNTEYVELRGAPDTLLDDLKLRLLDATGQVEYEVTVADAGTKMPANGVWVVGGALANVDQSVLLSNWGLDEPRGAVQLVRGPQKTLLDVVGWTNDVDGGALPPPASPPLATGEGRPALLPTIANRAFGRKQAAADTNDNRADFCVMAKSPRAAQQAACD